ncbi:hypothetical protein NL676_019546 [Syzygium grande]|nr:hypothetical protein NL676_019546 [Syzygium grande]
MKLVILDLSRSEITHYWEGWNQLKMAKNLKVLNLTECGNLRRTPDISALENLERLILQRCWGLVQVDKSIARAPSLQWISRLRKLESLELSCYGSASQLPSDFNLLSKLRELVLEVDNLECLPRLPQNLSHLRMFGPGIMEKSINLSYLEKLSELRIWNCEQLIEIQGLKRLKNLKMLRLYDLPLMVKLPDLTSLKKLTGLWIAKCPMLVEVREKLPDLTNSKKLKELYLASCPRVVEIPAELTEAEKGSSFFAASLFGFLHFVQTRQLSTLILFIFAHSFSGFDNFEDASKFIEAPSPWSAISGDVVLNCSHGVVLNCLRFKAEQNNWRCVILTSSEKLPDLTSFKKPMCLIMNNS